MFLSIIVAVYNIESYLERCLNSIIICDKEEFEVILVTGNSKDKSNEICKEYERRYKNITVLKQKGKGLSDARNCGIELASGDFIMFVDGDDCILTEKFMDTIRKLKEVSKENIDVLVSDFYMIDENDKMVSERFQITKTDELIRNYKQIKYFMKRYICFWNVWRYIYRREFLISNKIVFKENLLSEDIDYTTNVFLKTRNVVYYHNPYYCYRIGRKDSLMNIVNIKRVNDTVKIIESSVSQILKNRTFEYKELMTKKFLFEYILNIATIYEVPYEDRNKVKEIFMNTIYILNKDFYGFGRLVYMIIRSIGIEPVAFMLLYAKKTKRLIRRIKLTN